MNAVVLKSWYAQNSIVPVTSDVAHSPKPVASKPRARDNIKQSHAKSLGSSRSSSIPADKSQSLRSSQVHSRFLGHDQCDSFRKDLISAGNPTMRPQSRYIPPKPPASVQCKAEYEPTMSQLSYTEDWSGIGSCASQQSGNPSGLCSQSASSCRGVHPFNMNRSATESSSSASMLRMTSNQTSASSNCASFQPIPGGRHHPVTPAPFLPAKTPVAYLPLKNSIDPIGNPVYSRASSHDFYRSSEVLKDSKSLSTNSYNCVHQDFSQGSGSGSSSQYPGLVVPDLTSQELLDRRIKAILKETFQTEKKEFNENQRFLYRRISEAEDNHADYVREIDQKHKECMNQIKELGKKVSSFDRQVTNASNAHAASFVELDEKAKGLEASAYRIDEMHHKVVGMLKSVESSASALKDLAETSVAAVFQAKDNLIQSTLPHLKQMIFDMATTVVKDFGFNFQSTVTNASTVAPVDLSKTSNSIKNSKENYPLVVANSRDSSNAGTKKPKLLKVHEPCKSTPDVVQPSQAFSPVAAQLSQAFSPVVAPVLRVPKSSACTSPAASRRSCVTPCQKDRRDFTAHFISDTCTPVKKRTMATKTIRAKRQRNRFGNIRTLHIDSEETYAFLSN
jgi:hypothetical protein